MSLSHAHRQAPKHSAGAPARRRHQGGALTDAVTCSTDGCRVRHLASGRNTGDNDTSPSTCCMDVSRRRDAIGVDPNRRKASAVASTPCVACARCAILDIGDRRCPGAIVVSAGERVFELAQSLAEGAAGAGEALGSEEQQDDCEQDDEVGGLEDVCEHVVSLDCAGPARAGRIAVGRSSWG